LLSPLFTSFVGITAPGHVHVAIQRVAHFRIELQISNAGVAYEKSLICTE